MKYLCEKPDPNSQISAVYSEERSFYKTVIFQWRNGFLEIHSCNAFSASLTQLAEH